MKLENGNGNIEIIKDADGKSLVVVNDIRFKGHRRIDWKEVEKYLREYIGRNFQILETSEKIYVGSDFPDEFCHSKDTKVLKGTNAKAKANAAQAINELIQIASNKSIAEDYEKRHSGRARMGWYRYDTRFALPVYDETGEMIRYNIFSMRLLVRHSENGKMYLYDILRTKKEK